MNEIILIIITIVGGIFFGLLIGLFWGKVFEKILNKKIKKNAKKVLNGEKENNFDLEGKIIKVNKFIVKDEEGNEKKINFKEVKDGRR
jgi:Na+-translocating ferredoxin:NAD+ oxidoreductase RnfG subunit